MPPFDLLPAIAAYAVLVLIADAADGAVRRPLFERALLGAVFGFAYHLAGLWWIGAAFLVDAPTFGAFLPLAVVGLPILLAPFHAAAVALAGLAPPGLVWRTVALAGALSFTEWVRGFVFTGFPWNVPAVQLSSVPALTQAAAVVGVAGLAPFAVLIGAAPAFLLRGRWGPAAVAGLVALALAGGGALRLAGASDEVADGAPRVRIVQPAIAQAAKWDPAQRDAIWATLLDLTAAPAREGARPRTVIWPETALPFLYRVPSAQQRDLVEALGPGRTLVTGAVEIEPSADGRRVRNAILVIGDDGVVMARYDKAHLVPFGEYLPFAGLARRIGLTALVESASEFEAGAGGDTLAIPGLPAARPLICYEVIFRRAGRAAPVDWVLNVTNDAWFGDTPGPRQHLRHSRLRAIEEGVPVVRVANTGISGVIDAYGRMTYAMALNQRDMQDVILPIAMRAPYGMIGNATLYVWWSILLILGAITRVQPQKRRHLGMIAAV